MIEKPEKAGRVRGGVRLEHRKNTCFTKTSVMPPPAAVTIPMKQHIGSPCTPAVKKGDRVKVGTLVGVSAGTVCSPIYSSVSGTVAGITETRCPDGTRVTAVKIESDGLMEAEKTSPPEITGPEDFIEAVKRSGLVGLGGAGFPSHIKLTPVKGKPIDTLIVNCAECEPYITADHRECIEDSWDVFNGIYTVKKFVGAKNAYIAVENNKPDVIKVLLQIASDASRDPENRVRVTELKSVYPQGAEKMLVKAVTGRKIPLGGLPSDVGVLVMNVTTVAFISKYLKTGEPLTSRRVTVDGGAVERPQNVMVPIGTSVEDVLRFTGLRSEPVKIIMGGPMMGTALPDASFPVTKTTNAILAFNEEEAKKTRTTACIHCGKCVKNCPMGLMPLYLAQASDAGDVKELERLSVNACMECGTCVYNCPAGRHLVQAIRVGKRLLREEKAKKGETAK